MYNFPENLFTEVRIEKNDYVNYYTVNGEVETNNQSQVIGALIRVFDGDMWYSSTTNEPGQIQAEIDNLASLAKRNGNIYDHPVVKNFGSHKACILKYDGENDVRKITPRRREELVAHYLSVCADESIEEMKSYGGSYYSTHTVKEYYSSKGAAICQDMQRCSVWVGAAFVVEGVTTWGGKNIQGMSFDRLLGREQEILEERNRYLDYARNAVDIQPGDYICVMAPAATALFTHESFGHKSESDYMLSDRTLQEEWVLGKKVGNEKVSICDNGNMGHNGYTPYDDEGNEARETWLIREGVLTGRLHDSKSASVLGEEVTGNSRADSYGAVPLVRMTNTYMAAGSDDPENILRNVQDGIYVYD
ncbi:MAG: TldD/PmbA family protein, partial [Acetatifactor sp.]|nr:TldD/PmbA family protein [Acetatifactor sp.]